MTVIPLRVAPSDDDPVDALLEAPFRGAFIPPDPNGVYSIQPCVVVGCGRARRYGPTTLCAPHQRQHKKDSAVDFDAWLRTVDPKPAFGRDDDPAKHAVARGVFVLEPIRGRLRSEVAFGLQTRGTAAAPRPARSYAVNRLVRALAESNVTSLLDHDALDLVRDLGLSVSGGEAGFIRGVQAALHEALGLPGRRSIGLRRGGSGYFVDYSRIEPRWLGMAVQRWTEYRLSIEKASPQYAGTQVAALSQFADFLAQVGVDRPEQITRELLMRYREAINELRQPNGKLYGAVAKRRWIGTINTFLADVRHHEWVEGVPANARYLQGEAPPRPPTKPRFISEYVMRQLEAPASMAMIKRPDIRVVVLIMMTTGMRQIHVLTLERSCLVMVEEDDGSVGWALRFLDTKTKQYTLLPLEPRVAEAIKEQQERVDAEFGAQGLLFPRRHRGMVKFVPPQTLHAHLKHWCETLNLTDENGQAVRVTSHQFRHTCGTRWINNNVPAHIVKRLLGHRTDAMVGVYAQLHDSTVRAEWEKFQRINISGQPVPPPPGEVADVKWMIESLARATQALPNGYCGLPIQQQCPHANACLDCDNFSTSTEFLPVLEAQCANHERIMKQAEDNGHERLVEINRVPFVNLTKIIDSLHRLRTEDAQ